MARLDTDRQKALEPKRLNFAKESIEQAGYTVEVIGENQLRFVFKGHPVTFWPFTGWASGKSITDGRGIQNLLNQLK